MHDHKNNAPKENMPIPGKMRGIGNASANSYIVAVKRDMQNMHKTVGDLTGLVLQLSKVAVENMEMLARVEKKLDEMRALYESNAAQHRIVARPTSDGGLSYVDVMHDTSNAGGDTTPLAASVDAADGNADGNADGGSTDTGSIISMSAYKVDDAPAEATVDATSVPPGVREAVNEEYFSDKLNSETIISQEVIDEDIEDVNEPILLSRAAVQAIATPAEAVSNEKQSVVSPAVDAAPAAASAAGEEPALTQAADADTDIDNIVAKLANTSDADISTFTAVEPPKPVKKRAATAKPKAGTTRKRVKKVL